MNLRDRLGIFVLTKEEQRTVAFVILLLVLGLTTKHYRAKHAERTAPPNETRWDAISPTPH
jgi:hypothetical protein